MICESWWKKIVNNWYKLLEQDTLKQIIIDSLYYLHLKNKIEVYGFVIMPNHIHLIWKIKELNGKETPQGFLLKHTAHLFKQHIQTNDPLLLASFKVKAANKQYEFWQRDFLAFELTRRSTALQKLEYIHNNPLAVHWQLCNNPVDYYYSSATYYETEVDNFGFLTHIMDVT